MAEKSLINASRSSAAHSNIVLAIGLVTVLTTLLIPLPTMILDMLLACSISLAIAVLIITLGSTEALELSAFPSLLLFVTLFRLSLNVASTRLILTNGDAGKVIQTFGDFVAGGSFVVGLVIFLILVIIQFIVITKGSERISEVSARFTLDAMPGKQMAIDADLNAGAITEEEANRRRSKIVKESEFYGAMDGASKFIRGDAKAGIIITGINIIGGIAMGYSKGMTLDDALRTYSVLSIGDGLVSQIPSLIISLSSGFLVTKISSEHSVGQDLSKQFLRTAQPLQIAACIIAGMAFVPGLPKIPFLLFSAAAFTSARMIKKSQAAASEKQQSDDKPAPEKEPVENLLDVDRISVNVGVRLIGMVDPRKKSTVFDRIGQLRRRFAQDFGLIIPLVRLRDNINIEPTAYEIRLCEMPIATGKIEPDMFLAMDPGTVYNKVEGIPTKEPVYGLPAMWITRDKKELAEVNGYTVIDPESVFITHLSETMRKHAHELLTREDVQALVDRLRKIQPSLVGEVVGELVPVGLLQRVLKNLLANGLSIRELTSILESLGENAGKTKNAELLTEMVRKSLARTITEQFKTADNQVMALTIDPVLEHQLASSVQQDAESIKLNAPAETLMEFTRQAAQAWKEATDKGLEKVVLVCDARLRAPMANIIARSIPPLSVIAYDEIVAGVEIVPLTTISVQQQKASDSGKQLAGAR